ncbi:MAG: ABC transporter ATP-binding protein [Candidatus Brocadiia bacterium]
MTTPGIEIENLHFRIGDFVVKDLSLTVGDGEYFVLTGPNGAGKTVLIRLIAGLYQPTAGDIRLAGRKVVDLPPWERRVGYVPQDGVLFPNRTVRRNIAFGLEVRSVPPEQRRMRVRAIAEMLDIAHLLDREVDGLSGGETQKVSLGRALILEPDVLLLDEPVSAIDQDARDAICRELRGVQLRLGITTLHVSHSSRETELVADRVGRLIDGRLQTVSKGPGLQPCQ